jgi:hypothetical protein
MKEILKIVSYKGGYKRVKVAFTAQTSLDLYETAQIVHLITWDYPQ